MGGSSAAPVALRPSGFWVLSASGWQPTPFILIPGESYPGIAVHTGEGDTTVRLRLSDVRAMELVESRVLHEGLWFSLSGLRTDTGAVLRRAASADEARLSAFLTYDGPEIDRARALPGATYHDPRGGNGDVTVTIPLSRIDDYRETVTAITGVNEE